MNPQDNNQAPPQQQAIERLRTAVNVLVTMNNNPTVDQLSAAIGFTLALNKLGKHATAVFSGDIPSTLEFLKPEETIEKNTDSLRDFIVSLDKSKADKLRYKVEENVVKIFITPYKTSLSEKDLNYSQGDFNVDAVVALGVSEREQLDQAIISHGRILHDATVITICAGNVSSTLGAINWQDPTASSLSEMLVSVADLLQPGLLDNQIATAYLTGIVSETERFRNIKTTPKIMSMAAQLMAAGANQQLIAEQLEQAVQISDKPIIALPTINDSQDKKDANEETKPADGSLTIEHDLDDEISKEHDELSEELKLKDNSDEKTDEDQVEATEEIAIDEHGNLAVPGKKKHSKRQRIIEPISDKENNKPAHHPFSANMTKDEENEKSTDPLSLKPNDDRDLLSHKTDAKDKILPPIIESEVELQSEPQPDPGLLMPALDSSTLREIEKTLDSPHIANDPTSTLDEIEQVVDSPHLNQLEPDNLDSARDAVLNAIQAAPYNPNRPEPVQALNAAPIDFNLSQPTLSVIPDTTLPAADPVLSELGLTDNVMPAAQSLLPPPPSPDNSQQPAENHSDQLPPPVPPPLMPVR